MGWRVDKKECPNCKNKELIIWIREGECKLGTCTKCGLYISARLTHMVDTSFIVDELKGVSEDKVDVWDLVFSEKEMEKKNQDIIPKDSEW